MGKHKGDGGKAGGAGKRPGAGDGRQPKHSLDANRPSKGAGTQRDAATVRRLAMYKKRAVRDKRGRIIHEDLQSKELPSTRIQPDRRWFGNTRVIGQKQLDDFRAEMADKVNDAYTVLLREKKLPLQLLEDPDKQRKGKQVRHNLLAAQPFQATFGTGSKRKKPKLAVDSVDQLAARATERETDDPLAVDDFALHDAARDRVFEKGTSKRIWGELYKVLDSSDVVIQVLDARDPQGTRCRFLENHIRKHLRHKHLLLLLNKCDLVPSWVTKRWLHALSREFPTLAFHASLTNPFGKGALLSLLRQLARLRSDKQAISVGFVGYPNVGKSSVINALRTKKVCKAAPVPGETKVWQYVTLTKRVFLIDCPGVVYNRTDDGEDALVLKGVVRVEALDAPATHIPAVLARVKPEYLRRAYKVKEWADAEDFLSQLARLSGKLLKGGDPDLSTAARMVLYDWQRGKIPFFTLPPDHVEVLPGQADPAAAGAQRDDTPLPALPVPAGSVTEEDAAQEQGAAQAEAAAAARAARELLTAATELQTRSHLPVVPGYFTAEDEGAAEQAADEDDVDVISQSTSEAESDEAEQSDGSSSEDSDSASDEDRAPASGDSDAELEAEDVADRAVSRQPPARKPKRKAVAPAVEGSGDDSDGYGEQGLSWEAVMASVLGGEAEALPSAPAHKPESVDKARQAAKTKTASSAPAAAIKTTTQPRVGGGIGKKQKQENGKPRRTSGLKTLD